MTKSGPGRSTCRRKATLRSNVAGGVGMISRRHLSGIPATSKFVRSVGGKAVAPESRNAHWQGNAAALAPRLACPSQALPETAGAAVQQHAPLCLGWEMPGCPHAPRPQQRPGNEPPKATAVVASQATVRRSREWNIRIPPSDEPAHGRLVPPFQYFTRYRNRCSGLLSNHNAILYPA